MSKEDGSHSVNSSFPIPYSSLSKKAVFLDRDGTVIKDLEYLGDPDKVELLPGAGEALRLLSENGFLLVVISNQSGVARGFFDESACRAVDKRFRETLAAAGAPVAASYYCPHLPGAKVAGYDRVCDCRKPAKGLFQRAAGELGVYFEGSWAVGDSLRDLAPAKELGARTVLVLTGKGRQQLPGSGTYEKVDHIAADLGEAAGIILGRAF